MGDVSHIQRLALLAKLIDGEAIEVEGIVNRLRALGKTKAADKAAQAAKLLSVIPTMLTGASSDGFKLFFRDDRDQVEECESVAPEQVGAGVPLQYINQK
jgi:hypothetical protein